MNSPADQNLLDRARAGDHAALGDLLRRHQGRLYNVCLRMVTNRDDAAELTQDVMLKIVEHLPAYRGQAAITTWMTRIAMNTAVSHLRKRRLRRAVSLDGSPPNGRTSSNSHASAPQGGSSRQADALRHRIAALGEPGPAQRVQDQETLEQLRMAIDGLDDDFRAVLVLRDIQEMDYQEIAQTLEMPLGTVKSRLFRARLALRERMQADEDGRRRGPAAAGGDAGRACADVGEVAHE